MTEWMRLQEMVKDHSACLLRKMEWSSGGSVDAEEIGPDSANWTLNGQRERKLVFNLGLFLIVRSK